MSSLLLALSACSVEGYRKDADVEVYEILENKRDVAFGEEAPLPFKVEAAEDQLRKRLVEEIAEGKRPKLYLSLKRALEIAASNSRDFQAQKERLYLSALNLTGQRNRYSTIFSSTPSAVAEGIGDDLSSQGTGTAGISASKILGSGAQILGGFLTQFFRVFTSGNGWNATSLLSLSITQPLLAGFGSEVALEPLTQAERNTIYAIRDYERFRRSFAVDIISDYLGVLEQANNLSNEDANLVSLQNNKKRSEALAEEDKLPKFELDQAVQRELSAQNNMIVSRARLETTVDRFKITLALPIEVHIELDDKIFDELKTLGVGPMTLSPQEAIKIAIANRLDLKNAEAQVIDAERQVRVTANALKMGLDLSAAIEVPNERPEKFGKFNFGRFNWELGIGLDLPLNKVAERNVYRTSLLSLDAERRSHELLSDTIKQGIRNSLRNVEQSYLSFEIQKNSVTLAKDRVENEKLLLELGRGLQTNFLDAQNDLLSSQNSLTSALVDYVINKLSLLRDLELLDVGKSGLEIDLSILKRWTKDSGSDKKDDKK